MSREALSMEADERVRDGCDPDPARTPCPLRYEAPPPVGRRHSTTFAPDPVLARLPRDFGHELRSFLVVGGWRFDVTPGPAGGVGPIRERVHMDAWGDDHAEWTRGTSFPTIARRGRRSRGWQRRRARRHVTCLDAARGNERCARAHATAADGSRRRHEA
ncbi:MAG: hypothetical protein IT379_11585 [Deltaproteobacteria bacterium]|nr:hypothetical protein [Deltaproteobacteria bacterium]